METWFWVLGWILSFLTISANGFTVLIVCCKRQLMRSKANAFVVSLAVADFFVGVTVVPFSFFCHITGACDSPGALLSWTKLLRWLFGYASVMNLCSLVLDRYLAVVKPLRYETWMTCRRVQQIIIFSWTITIGLTLFPLSYLVFSKLIFYKIFSWLVLIFFEFLPCCLLVFNVGAMIHVVLRHNRTARSLAKQLTFNHKMFLKTHERTTVNIIATVVGLFLLCYAFFIRCSVMTIADGTSVDCGDDEYKIPLLLLNSAINPFVYALVGKKDIRRELKKVTYVVRFKRNKEQN